MRSGRHGARISAVAGSSITKVAATVNFSSVAARRPQLCQKRHCPPSADRGMAELYKLVDHIVSVYSAAC